MEHPYSRARSEDRNRSAQCEELDGNELSLLGGTDQLWGQPQRGRISRDDRVLKLTERHSGMRQPNSGLPEFGNIIVQVGNSRLGWRRPGIHTPGRGYGFRVRATRAPE